MQVLKARVVAEGIPLRTDFDGDIRHSGWCTPHRNVRLDTLAAQLPHVVEADGSERVFHTVVSIPGQP